jgi:hypothetical protein
MQTGDGRASQRLVSSPSGGRNRRNVGEDSPLALISPLGFTDRAFSDLEKTCLSHLSTRLFGLAHQPARSDALFGTGRRVSLLGTLLEALQTEETVAGFTEPTDGLETRTGFPIPVDMGVRNLSGRRWPAVAVHPRGLVGMSFRVMRPNRARVSVERIFSRLPGDLKAGESATFVAWLRPIRAPGRHQVVPCVVQMGFDAEHCKLAKAIPPTVGPVLAHHAPQWWTPWAALRHRSHLH